MDNSLLFCATDKELFDVYMSSPGHFSERTLLDAAARRGIIYSPRDSRQTLADTLSSQIHGYTEISEIETFFERAGRSERTTSLTFDEALTQAEIKKVTNEIVADGKPEETVTASASGNFRYDIDLAYSELDFGATRFRQRKSREAKMSFSTENGKTVLRYPATQKAREFVKDVVDRLEKTRKAPIQRTDINLTAITSADQRTQFFLRLIQGVPNTTLENVLQIKVELGQVLGSAAVDEDEAEAAKEEMLSEVRKVALSGKALLSTTVYQHLRDRGYYISSITWHSMKTTDGRPIVEYEAGFEDAKDCRDFRYAVRGWKRLQDTGMHSPRFVNVPDLSKDELLKEIEMSSVQLVQEFQAPPALPGSGDEPSKV